MRGASASAARAVVVRAATAAIAVVLSCVTLEVLLRLTENGRLWKRPFAEEGAVLIQRPAAMYDPHTGARFMPDWSGRFYFSGNREFVTVRTNALGFRSPEYPQAKPAGLTRVALIGDSLVAGLQVEADVHFRSILEGALGTLGPVQVMNFAIPGTGPVTHLNLYREYAKRFQPDAVVTGVYTANDFMDNANLRWQAADGSVLDEPFNRAPGNIGKFLKANSCLVMVVWALIPGHRVHVTHARSTSPPEPTAALQEKPSFELAGVPEAAYDKAIAVWDEMIDEVTRDGASLIMILFPDHTSYTEEQGWDYARPATKLLHQRLARHFVERGATVIIGSDILRRHTERYGAVPFSGWKSYLSREAHQTLAEVLAEDLMPSLPGTSERAQRAARPYEIDGAHSRTRPSDTPETRTTPDPQILRAPGRPQLMSNPRHGGAGAVSAGRGLVTPKGE